MRSWLLLSVLLISGCWKTPAPPPNAPPLPPEKIQVIPKNSPDPRTILNQMVMAYQTAVAYSDSATAQIIGKMSQPNTGLTSWDCMVAFQKPNKLQLKINKGIFIAEGKDCYAKIRPLPGQVLHFPAPELWTLDMLFRNVHLDVAMELGLPPSVLRFPPQLILLFANNPLNTFCPQDAKIEWLGQQSVGLVSCNVIRISHTDGNRILWVSQENQALLRLEYQPVGLPVPEGFESIEAIRLEMTNAQFDWDFSPEPYLLPNEVQVSEFNFNGHELVQVGLPTPEEHQRQLELMKDSDCYRIITAYVGSAFLPKQPPPKVEPQTFTLSQVWMQPFVGASTMSFLPDEPPKLLVQCEGNSIAILDLMGKVQQKISPKELENSIIVNIQAGLFPAGKQRVGLITLDNQVYLFDTSFKLLAEYKGEIQDFRFIGHQAEVLLLLGMQQDSAQKNTTGYGIVHAIDLKDTKRWEYRFEGVLNQISSAETDNKLFGQPCVLVSCTGLHHDSILVFSIDGSLLESLKISPGRHILWTQALDTTLYALSENINTGDIRFIGLDRNGKVQWSRLLPSGEYEVDPLYVQCMKKWFVPTPSGTIFVFDMIGNLIDTFSLNIIPTGLLYAEFAGESLLIVADGETVSAWKLGKISEK